MFIKPYSNKTNMEIVAHRGLVQDNIKENSLDSVKNALKYKINVLEIDLRKTKDNQIVLHHNREFIIGNQGYYIDQLTLKELKQLINITPLDEIFKIWGKNKIFLDIKVTGAEQEILNLIKKHKMEKYVVIDSFLPKVTKKFREIAPKLEYAAPFINKTWKGILWYPFYTFFFPRKAVKLKAKYIEVPAPLLKKSFIKKSHALNLKVVGFYFKKNIEIIKAINNQIDFLMLDTIEQIKFAKKLIKNK